MRHVARDDTLSRGSIPSLTLLIHRSRRKRDARSAPRPGLLSTATTACDSLFTHTLESQLSDESSLSTTNDVSRRLRGTRRLEMFTATATNAPRRALRALQLEHRFSEGAFRRLERRRDSARAWRRARRPRGRSPRFSRRDGGRDGDARGDARDVDTSACERQ